MKIGVRYPVYSPATETDSSISYGAGVVLAKAISIKITTKTDDGKVYADDGVCETDRSFVDGTISLTVDDLYDYAKVDLLAYVEGNVADGTIGTKELSVSGDADPPSVGFGFYAPVKRSGLRRYRAIWLKKVQFAEPSDEFETQADKTVFKPVDIGGEIMVAADTKWKEEATFATAEGAKTWLQTKAGISTSVSGGLTALSMTGTGGSLSPAFGATVRSYSFGGLTATSFTMTATAANHTLKLYVDGVFNQDLTSGAASTAIAMATTGSKHLQLVAQENGKAPVVYDFIVIKTA